MPRDSDLNRLTVSFEELTCSNTLILQALMELLSEKGLFDWKEVLDRVQKLNAKAAGKSGA